jgi:hypothetical protein
MNKKFPKKEITFEVMKKVQMKNIVSLFLSQSKTGLGFKGREGISPKLLIFSVPFLPHPTDLDLKEVEMR